MVAFLNRENTVAPLGFNRWLVPPAALSIHLAIGQAYAFSVFNIPMSKLIGISPKASYRESTIPYGSRRERSMNNAWVLIIAWFWAGVPLAWGITQTLQKALALFQ